MSKPKGLVKQAVLVSIGSLVIMGLSFSLYVVLFRIMERLLFNPGGDLNHNFVSPLRMGYGLIWILLVLLLYRTRLPDWLKAVFLAGGLASLGAAFGVQAYQYPVLVIGLILSVLVVTVLLLRHRKSAWYHYFAAILATAASFLYTAPQ